MEKYFEDFVHSFRYKDSEEQLGFCLEMNKNGLTLFSKLPHVGPCELQALNNWLQV
jgi:hypothetical protein